MSFHNLNLSSTRPVPVPGLGDSGREEEVQMTVCTAEQETKDYETVESIFRIINIVMPIFAVLALIANLNFIIAISYGIRRGRLPLKRYVMTINRCLADLATIIIAGSYYVHENFNNCNNEHICFPTDGGWFGTVLQAAFILNYWSVSLSYTGIAILTYYAVRSPLQYKVRLTASTVIRMILASWGSMIGLLFLCVLIFHGGELNYNGNSVIHLFLDDFGDNDPMGIWLVDLCVQIDMHPPHRSALVTMIPPLLFYLISIFCYLLISQELFYRRSTNIYKRHRSAMWRLGSHLLLFSITCFLTGTAYYGSIPMGLFCRQQKTNPNVCMSPVVSYTSYTAAAVLGWFARMAIDGCIDTYVDGVLRRSIVQTVRPKLSTFTLTTAADTRHPTELPSYKLSSSRNSECINMETLLRKASSSQRKVSVLRK